MGTQSTWGQPLTMRAFYLLSFLFVFSTCKHYLVETGDDITDAEPEPEPMTDEDNQAISAKQEDYMMPIEGPESCGLCKKAFKERCKKDWFYDNCKDNKKLCKKYHPKMKKKGKRVTGCAGE